MGSGNAIENLYDLAERSRYIVVDFQVFDGEVLAFVVRLVQIVANAHRVARYDTAHGPAGEDFGENGG